MLSKLSKNDLRKAAQRCRNSDCKMEEPQSVLKYLQGQADSLVIPDLSLKDWNNCHNNTKFVTDIQRRIGETP